MKNNLILKILSFGFCLAVSMVLIAKVCFDLSYDTFYSGHNRIYTIKTNVQRGEDEGKVYNRVSGAVAPGFKEYVPGVESATRITEVYDSELFYTEDSEDAVSGSCVLADTSFFDVFSRPILSGVPKEALGKSLSCMVSRSFADKIGGVENAVGKQISNQSQREAHFTINGVYEDFPDNGRFHYDVLLSMASYSKGSYENWVGNDRYIGFVKLYEGIDPETLTDAIHLMQEKNQPLEAIEKNGVKAYYSLVSLQSDFLSDKTEKTMLVLLSVVAVILLLISVLNYGLIAVSNVIKRSREISVRKCFGAEGKDISVSLLKETAKDLLLSLFVAVALIFAFKGQIRSLTDVSVSSLLLPQTLLVLALVCVVVLLVSAIIPSVVYQKIPIAVAIRHYKDSKRKWKLALLFFQFAFSVILVSLVFVATAQYRKSVSADLGYKYDRLVYFSTVSDGETVVKAIDRLKQLPEIEDIQTCTALPLSASSGNNIYLPGSNYVIMNIADQYFGTPGFFSIMGIDIKEGSEPKEPNDIAVSRSFADKLTSYASWEDGVIGKAVKVSEHSRSRDEVFTICGIYDDYSIGSGTSRDDRPSARFCSDFGGEYYDMYFMPYVLIKLNALNPSSIQNINSALQEILPDEDVAVTVYSDAVESGFASFKKLRNTFFIGCLLSLLIALLGLIGYVKDEVNRRSAEMAIRKINGATTFNLVSLFIGDVLKIAAAAFVAGDIAAFILSRLLFAQMPEKTDSVVWLILLSNLVLVVVLTSCVVINSLGISRANPVDSIKTE